MKQEQKKLLHPDASKASHHGGQLWTWGRRLQPAAAEVAAAEVNLCSLGALRWLGVQEKRAVGEQEQAKK